MTSFSDRQSPAERQYADNLFRADAPIFTIADRHGWKLPAEVTDAQAIAEAVTTIADTPDPAVSALPRKAADVGKTIDAFLSEAVAVDQRRDAATLFRIPAAVRVHEAVVTMAADFAKRLAVEFDKQAAELRELLPTVPRAAQPTEHPDVYANRYRAAQLAHNLSEMVREAGALIGVDGTDTSAMHRESLFSLVPPALTGDPSTWKAVGRPYVNAAYDARNAGADALSVWRALLSRDLDVALVTDAAALAARRRALTMWTRAVQVPLPQRTIDELLASR